MGLLYFPQDAQVAHWMCQCTIYAHICTRFSPNVQYMHKICTRLYLFAQCARFVPDCTYFSNVQYMCKICARLYSTGHSQRDMLKTLMNSYKQIRSFGNKNEVSVNKFIKIRKNKVTTLFLIHENKLCLHPRTVSGQTTLLSKQFV